MLFVFSAPSGSGKSTLINHLMSQVEGLTFSVSATSRAPRGEEKDGVEYHFMSEEEFRQKIAEDAFVEYEEVYAGTFYGTLKSEIDGRLAKRRQGAADIHSATLDRGAAPTTGEARHGQPREDTAAHR